MTDLPRRFVAEALGTGLLVANPAVTIARALTDTFAGIPPIDAPAFIVAQISGALLAWALAGWLWAPNRQHA